MKGFQERRLGEGKTHTTRSLEGQVGEVESAVGFPRREQNNHICILLGLIRECTGGWAHLRVKRTIELLEKPLRK